MNETLYWITLAGIFGPGSSNLWKLMRTCESPAEAYRMISEGRFPLTPGERNQFKIWTPEKASSVSEICAEKNISIITFSDESYPSKLKTIFNPPAVLYAYGNVSCLNDEITVGVVGTREPSKYGYDAAFRISEELAKVGVTTVSGFAAGIDSACHRGTLKGGGRTIAVLGCGPDQDYPKVNGDIRETVAAGGVLVSEYPPGTIPYAKNFPLRNRIISGLSLGVFVAEAPLRSGALITADYAVEQGRDVFCLPPSDIFSKSFQGVVKYLRDGAVPVFSHLDILYEYYTTFSHKLSPPKPADEYITGISDSFFCSGTEQKVKKSPVRKAQAVKKSAEEKPAYEFTGNQKKIADALFEGPLHIDEISEKAEIDIQELMMELTDMEISGSVVSLPGKVYSLG